MRSVVLLLLSALLLAGCTDGPQDSYVPDEPAVVTDPAEVINGTDQAHIHDYWGGQDALTIIDGEYGWQCTVCVEQGRLITPEDGTVVPQGTSHVEITIGWTESPGAYYDQPELWLKTAGQNEPMLLGALEQGATQTVETTLQDADLPHQILSGWELTIRIGDLDRQTVNAANLVFDVEMVAMRGLDLPVFPAHPDHWENTTEIELFSGSQFTAAVYFGGGFTGNSFVTFNPDDGVIVPPGTDTVEVHITNGSPMPLHLEFHGADSRAWTVMEMTRAEGFTQIFEIPVERLMADGPYAKQSLWEFRVEADAVAEAEPYGGNYEISAVAIKAPAP